MSFYRRHYDYHRVLSVEIVENDDQMRIRSISFLEEKNEESVF